MLRRVVAWVLVSAALLPAASASAAVTPLTLGKGDYPSVGVDTAGNAYVVWNGPRVANVSPLMFCRVSTGASACDGGARALEVPGSSESRPFVFVSGQRVLVAQSRFAADPAVRGVYLITSADGGATFGLARNVGDLGLMLDAVAGPGDTISFVTSSAVNLRFQNVAADATVPAPTYATLSPGGGSALRLGAVDLDGGTPFVLLYDAAGNAAWRRHNGGDPNDAASWSATSTPGYLGEEPGLAGGPLGLFASGRLGPTSTRPIVRRFAGSGFAAPVTIDTTSANPVIGQDAGKRLHAVYGAFDLKHAVSDNGTTWKAETLVKGASPSGRPWLAVAPDHTGAVVYWSGGEIRLARLRATSSSAATSKTITVAGGTVTLAGPRRCVPPHESFTASITSKRKSEDARFVSVTRVVWFIDGRTHATDRNAPFRQSLLQFNVPAGTAHSLKARVTIKLRRGAPVTRTIAVGFQYCAS